MSSITPSVDAETLDRSPAPGRADQAGNRTRWWVWFVVTGIALAYSVVEVISLGSRHTTGPELYGVLVAILAAGAGIANLALLRSGRPHAFVTIAVLVLWAVIALGGVAGTMAHIVGPSAEYGPVDLRPRPTAAPLAFTLLGLVGGAALLFGQRTRRQAMDNGKE
jgi:hypothetical protein